MWPCGVCEGKLWRKQASRNKLWRKGNSFLPKLNNDGFITAQYVVPCTYMVYGYNMNII